MGSLVAAMWANFASIPPGGIGRAVGALLGAVGLDAVCVEESEATTEGWEQVGLESVGSSSSSDERVSISAKKKKKKKMLRILILRIYCFQSQFLEKKVRI